MLNFAYGSNLSSKWLRKKCPSASFVMRAYLHNFRVDFPFYSDKRKGGISSILPAPSELVRGVIYEIPEEEIEILDRAEGVPQGLYKRETFLVVGEDNDLHRAELYRVVEPGGPFTPARSYIEDMIEGAKEHSLDPDYIKTLEKLLI